MEPSAEIQGPVWVDASALVKLYLPEPESDELGRLLSGRRDLLVSELAITEIVSAAARRQRQGDLGGARQAVSTGVCWRIARPASPCGSP